jgi:MoaA/NifB/PqqE/SkfB family radical SAM enzyme
MLKKSNTLIRLIKSSPARVRHLAGVLSGRRTPAQLINLVKYCVSRPGTILSYAPLRISIAATDRCNLRCDFCHAHSARLQGWEFNHEPCPDIDFGMFCSIVDTFRRAYKVSIIGSGEPLLNPEFFKMVDYAAKKRRMEVFTVTNGTFHPDLRSKIVGSSLTNLRISINGHDPASFERLSGMPGWIFDTVMENVRCLVRERNRRRSRLRIEATFVIDKSNGHDIPEMAVLARKSGVDAVFFHQFLPTRIQGFTPRERCLFVKDEEAAGFFKTMDVSRFGIPVELPQLLGGCRKRCGVYFEQVRIDGDGKAGACSIMLLNHFGGRFDEPGVWNSDHFRTMRGIFLSKDTDDLPWPCRHCTCSFGSDVACESGDANRDCKGKAGSRPINGFQAFRLFR